MRISVQMSMAPGGGVTLETRTGWGDDSWESSRSTFLAYPHHQYWYFLHLCKSVSIVVLVDLFWLNAVISTGIFHVCVLFKEPMKPCFVSACTINFIAVVIIFHSSWQIVCRISILSHIHNEQFNFPNNFMQLIAFPCQMILTLIILRSSSLVGFTSFLQWCAKWLAKESNFVSVITSFLTSLRCWPIQSWSFCCVCPM
jgi:hypothetical protein